MTGPENPSIILGYFALTLCEVKTEHLPALYAGKFPEHGLPAVRLARLAVDTRFQGCGYGGRLLAEAIHRTVLIAEHAGVIGLFVDAKDETARLFYQRYGFKSLPDNVQKLFLPIETLRKGSPR
jgi:ribosomal protein S18 acetylase RimI-like enzyme